MPRKTTKRVDDPDVPYVVEFTFDLSRESDPLSSVTLIAREDGPPLTTDGLRQVPLARLHAEAVESMSILPPGTLAASWADLERDVALRMVAEIYDSAVLHRRPPTRTVAEWLHTSRATAGRLIAEARATGVLDTPAPNRPQED